MKLQQLRCIYEVVQNGYNISNAANTMHTSQPGVSKQILLIEDEIGTQIFKRHGKRLVGLTDPGKKIYNSIANILRESNNIINISAEYKTNQSGPFTIATTHTQARYKLPAVVKAFVKKYPNVDLNIHQGNPAQVTEQVLSGEAEVGIATEAISLHSEIFCLPCYSWNRSLVLPKRHPLENKKNITLKDISTYPLITYDYAFTGSTIVSNTFKKANLQPNIMLTAIDADVIKTYVNLNLGIGLVAEMAFNQKNDTGLVARDVSHLFPISTTFIGVRQDAFVRGFTMEFMSMFIRKLTKKELEILLQKRDAK